MSKSHRVFLLILLTLQVSVISGVAMAAVLEEVLVTAQKREQNLQDVGIAITTMTGRQMEALGFSNAQQIAAMAPGVHMVQPNGEANYSMNIRGVTNSDFITNVESPVALYVDEVYISQMSGAGFGLFDMERVEILRGPQGTLFGRNATGGLVHFITKKPSQEVDGYTKVTFGAYDQLKLEGAMGGGVTEDLSVRVSFATHDNDGYVENRLTDEKLSNANDREFRLQALYQPNDDLEFLLNVRKASQLIRTGYWEYVSSVTTGKLTPGVPNPLLGGYTDNDGDNFAGDYDDPGFNDLEIEGYSGTIRWAINDSLTLVSITDKTFTDRSWAEDSDASPVSLWNTLVLTDAEQFSQELRLEGETGSYYWVAGAYYIDIGIDDAYGGITDPFLPAAGTTVPGSEGGIWDPYSSDLESWSVFGQVEYAFSDRLNFIVGVRSVNDDKTFSYRSDHMEFLDPFLRPSVMDASNLNLIENLGTYQGERSDSEWAYRVQLDWNVSDTSLAYFSWNRGVKGGGYNAPIFEPAVGFVDEVMTFDPELLDSFEIGYKTDLSNIGRLNAAAYYYDYENYQIFNIVGLDSLTVNAPSAEALGFEVELQLSPSEGWDILFGVAYNDAEITMLDGSKQVPVQSPKWNLNGMLRYAFPVFGGEIGLQADAVYRDNVIFTLTAQEPSRQDAYTVANVSATYTSQDGDWQVSAFIHNVLDEEYIVQTFDLSGLDIFGMTEQYYGLPRWWGVSLRYQWGD